MQALLGITSAIARADATINTTDTAQRRTWGQRKARCAESATVCVGE
jgi:hypothetical protein